MGVWDEILAEFFAQLKTRQIPAKVETGLEKLLESGELASREKILEVIREAAVDAEQHKGH